MQFIELEPGKSVNGNLINAFIHKAKAPAFTYLLAGTHGDEPEGVYLLERLFSWLKQQTNLDVPLVVIPVLNVDGYAKNSRVNANGVDLNRNLPASSWSPNAREPKYNPGIKPLSEPENIFFNQILQNYKPSFILSFHSWKPMLNYNGRGEKIAQFLHSFNQYPVCDDIQGHPTPGSLGEYATDILKVPVLTFEAPVITESLTLEDIWKENEQGLKALFTQALIK